MKGPIDLEGLHFGYPGGQPLFRDLRLRVPEGSCFGILGPNGAGKTTLLKLMLGLLRPRGGEVRLFGRSPQHDKAVFRRVGTLVEGPHLYPHLSGRENARVVCTYRGLAERAIGRVLDMVDLVDAADRPVRQYSTGMKQRLALAIALLPDPDLLLLDEPTHGLDPRGIADMRRIIRRLHRDQGKTIGLSSHLLGEVEQVCTHLGVLDRGKVLFQGSLEELRRRFPRDTTIDIEVDDAGRGRPALEGAGFSVSASEGAVLSVTGLRRDQIPQVVDLLRASGVALFQLRAREHRLEDLFLDVLAGQADENGAGHA